MIISIIIPAFNVESQIERCIASIFTNPSSVDLDVIVIEDRSSDDTLKVLHKLQKQFSFRLLQMEKNSGPGLSRNLGLQRCIGDYILFVDGDDFLEDNFIYFLSQQVVDIKYDLVVFNHQRYWDNKPSVINLKASLLSELDVIEKNDTKNKIKLFDNLNVPWNKLYNKNFLKVHNLVFNDGYYEDVPFSHISIIAATNIKVIEHVGYNYYQRNGSILNSKSDKHFDIIKQYSALFNYISEQNKDEYKDKITSLYIRHVFKMVFFKKFRLTDNALSNIFKNFTNNPEFSKNILTSNISFSLKLKYVYLKFTNLFFHKAISTLYVKIIK